MFFARKKVVQYVNEKLNFSLLDLFELIQTNFFLSFIWKCFEMEESPIEISPTGQDNTLNSFTIYTLIDKITPYFMPRKKFLEIKKNSKNRQANTK